MKPPALELYIDELVIDGALLGPGGHGPDFGRALQSELQALLSKPEMLASLSGMPGGARMIRSLDAGALQLAGPGLHAGSLAPQLAQAVFGAIGTGTAPPFVTGLATGPAKENP